MQETQVQSLGWEDRLAKGVATDSSILAEKSHGQRNLGGFMGFPGGSDSKESTCNAQQSSSIPGSGRSPGGGHGNPLQYSCLENPMDRGAWWATVHEVARSQTRLSNGHFDFPR